MEEHYVFRLMMARCSKGNKDNYLNLPYDHGVTFGSDGQPLLNANDHISDQHVIHFGRCSSMCNPKNSSNAALANILTPGVGGILQTIGTVTGVTGCKCQPKTPVPWLNVNDKYLIAGAPAITTNSVLPCYYGGVISIVPIEELIEKQKQQIKEGESE